MSTDQNWFDNGLCRKLGEGNSIQFWNEPWCGRIALRDRFTRLYLISAQQNTTIKDVGNWVEGSWHWNLHWSRPLLEIEEERLEDLLRSLATTPLFEGRRDKWWWEPNAEGFYTVSSAYTLLQGLDEEEPILVFKDLWQVRAPSNAKAFAWRALQGRIPTKENLRKRGIIQDPDAVVCPFCSTVEETLDHLLFSCTFSTQVWNSLYNWFGIISVLPENCRDHFQQHGSWARTGNQKRGLQTIWLATLWSLWLHRNRIVFRECKGRFEGF